MTEYLREVFSGKIIGILEHESNGDITARDYPSQVILGYYRKSKDMTISFSGKMLIRGNAVVCFFIKNTRLFD